MATINLVHVDGAATDGVGFVLSVGLDDRRKVKFIASDASRNLGITVGRINVGTKSGARDLAKALNEEIDRHIRLEVSERLTEALSKALREQQKHIVEVRVTAPYYED